MSEDRRHSPRFTPASYQGVFVLWLAGHSIPVLAIRDISPFGMGISVAQPIPNGSAIKLVYSHQDSTITVEGTVVWGVPERHSPAGETAGYRIGVSLQPHAMAANSQLFALLTNKMANPALAI